jgi:hypothetical protein
MLAGFPMTADENAALWCGIVRLESKNGGNVTGFRSRHLD